MTNKQFKHKRAVDLYSYYLTNTLKIALVVGIFLTVLILE